MFARTIRLLAIGACLSVAGCSFGPRLDATSAETLSASLAKYVAAGPAATRPERSKVVASLRAVYFDGDKLKAKLPVAVPPASNLHKLRYEDVPTIAGRIVNWAANGQKAASRPQVEESPIERRWRNQFMVEQLQVQRDILTARRELARYRDLFTVDQLQFADASFIPPQEGVPIGQDKAMFVATFTNEAMFNVYGVAFHVVVTDPRMKFPVVDQVIKFDAAKLPIQVGESREVQLTCCDSFADPTRNLQLRTLPADADIQMDLVSVVDFSKKNRLEKASFTSAENLKLVATENCLQDLTSRMDAWTPQNASPSCTKY